MSTLDVGRLSPNLKTVEFIAVSLTVEEDGVDFDHCRIIYWYKEQWRNLMTCYDGIFMYMTEDAALSDLEKIEEWQKQK